MRIFRPEPGGGSLMVHGCSLRVAPDRLIERAGENLGAAGMALAGVAGGGAVRAGGGLLVCPARREAVSVRSGLHVLQPHDEVRGRRIGVHLPVEAAHEPGPDQRWDLE